MTKADAVMDGIESKFIPLEFVEVERDEQLERGQRFFEMIARHRRAVSSSPRQA